MATIEISGFIDSFLASEVLSQIKATTESTIRVNISSRGGDFAEALGIFNALRESRKRIVTAAQGFAGSAGAFLLLAGDEVHAAANAVIMFHMPSFMPGKALNSDEMVSLIENMRSVEESLVNTLETRTAKSKEEITTFLKEEVWMTAEKAKTMGIVDKILPFRRRKIRVDDTQRNVPVEIANFINEQNQEVEKMSLKSICEKFSIKIGDDADEDQITNAIVTHFETIPDPPAPPAPPKEVKKEKEPPVAIKLPGTLLNMVKRSRATEINSLVSEGKITSAVGKSLETVYCDDDRISNAVNDEGDITDTFEATIDALKKNEKVLNLGDPLSGIQQIPKQIKDDENPLLRDAESRAGVK